MTKQANLPYQQARDGNRAFWDEITPHHLGNYGVDRFLEGEPWLPAEILQEVGDVQGLSLLHLQCHFGLDSLAWVREGAQVTGVDFSQPAIEAAQALSAQASLPARFVCSDIYTLPDNLTGSFDIVFTSIGVLCWLQNLDAWARIIADFLKPGGFFYIMEGHPLMSTFDDDGTWQFMLSYFHKSEPYLWDGDNYDYMDPTQRINAATYEWQWSLSDVINALLRAGLRLEFFNEHEALKMPVYPEMVQREDGLYTLPGMPVPLPVVFSLKARKDHG